MDEITARTDLSKTTLREHLLQLERDGYIHRIFLRSGPGRPKLSYRLTTSGHRLFPSSESELLRSLLKYLKSEGNEAMIEHFFESYWEKRLEKAHDLLRNIPRVGIREKITTLCEMLEEEGFMPEFEIGSGTLAESVKEPGELAEIQSVTDFGFHSGTKTESKSDAPRQTVKIRECNCPFSQAIRETRLPCKLEAKFYERLFQQKMVRTSYIADGEYACTYEFEITDLT